MANPPRSWRMFLTGYPKRFSETIGEVRPNPPKDPTP